METIEIGFDDERAIELDEVDIGVEDEVIVFDVAGRIVGLDEATLSRVAGARLVPTRLQLEVRET